jgi:DNA-binding transcriptional MerR regulator
VNEEVNIEGASAITGIPVPTLRFWRATDQGPKSYTIGNRLRYDVSDLEAWMEAEKAKTVRGGVL